MPEQVKAIHNGSPEADFWIRGYDPNLVPYFVDREPHLRISNKAADSVEQKGSFRPKATCFFVQAIQDQHRFDHMVTAEHVVSGLLSRNHDLWLRVNTRDGGVLELRLDPKEFYFHPRAEVEPTDVAVYPFNANVFAGLEHIKLDVSVMQLHGDKGNLFPMKLSKSGTWGAAAISRF
jgi:hypothetical protein